MQNRVNRLTLILLIVASIMATGAVGQGISLDLPSDQPPEQIVAAYSVLSVTSAAAGQSYPAATVVNIVPGWHINSAYPTEDWLIAAQLEPNAPPGFKIEKIVYPMGHDVKLLDQTISVYDDSLAVFFLVTIEKSVAAGEYTIPINFSFQPCNDKNCLAPESIPANLEVTVGAEGDAVAPTLFAGKTGSGDNLNEGAAAGQESELQQWIDKYGFWGYIIVLGIAFITGLLLSFSPCTYPMIPITVSIFAGQDRSVGRGFILSLFYVGTMALVYGIMGLIVSLVGGVFGAWLANPAVVIGIAIVFVVFSLSMFGLYELNVPMSLRQKLGTKRGGGGVLGSIILGVVAALVVSPCVGPFVAGILLYVAAAGSPAFGFLVLFIFALGLGTLYVIIATFSSAIKALPGAGGWMDTVKRFFGFVLLMMAIYFLRTVLSPDVTAILTGLLLLALGVFGGGLDRLDPGDGFFLRMKKFIGLLALLVAIYLLGGSIIKAGFIHPPAAQWLPQSGASQTKTPESLINWGTELQPGLEEAKASGKPVLIDTWATWCVNCRVLEKKTFNNPDVAREAARFVSLKIQLETATTDETKEFMQRFGMKHYSLPTVLLLDSNGDVAKIFQGVIGPDEMIAAMREVN